MLVHCATIPPYSSAATLVDGGDAEAVAPDARTPDATAPEAGPHLLRIFVTRGTHDGAFAFVANSGALSTQLVATRADALCDDAWFAVHRERRSWRALIWPATNVSPFGNLREPTSGWYRVPPKETPKQESLVFENVEEITSGKPPRALINDEFGDRVFERVWTGGTVNVGSNDNCGSWQSRLAAVTGETGDPSFASPTWFGSLKAGCEVRLHLYCLEVPQ